MLRGTGPESVTKYQDSVYCAKADASALCVDPPQPLRTHPGRRARGATLAQTTRFPPRGRAARSPSGR
uniref:hypothetical protein n=1 Tax=Streptomyces prasinopilosus TaxID=67344 RepID=UPI000B24CA0E